MGKVLAVVATVFALLLLLSGGIAEMLVTTPPEELPEDLHDYAGYYQIPDDVGEIDWLMPLRFIRVGSSFGWRIHPIYEDLRFHKGVDLGAAQGEPIYATRAGTVVTAAYDSSSGNYVTIEHDEHFQSSYLHMTSFVVAAGETVEQGQLIGYVGSTGDSTAPHLHFAVYYDGHPVDPIPFIVPAPSDEETEEAGL